MQFISNIFTLACICAIPFESNGVEQNNSTVKHTAVVENETYFLHIGDVQDSSPAPVITSKSRTSKSDRYLLTWKPGSNLTFIKSFRIRYRKSLPSSWKYVTVVAKTRMLRLNHLQSSSLYEVEMVEVLADNSISQLAMSSFRTGNSKPSLAKQPGFSPNAFQPMSPENGNNTENHRNPNHTITDTAAQVPGAPLLHFVSDTSPTSISLTWRSGSNGGSPITGYKIQVRTIGSRRSKWKNRKEIISADTRTYNIDKLKRGLSYKFRIIAINAIGESVPSQSTRPHSTNSRPLRKLTLRPVITNVVSENGSLRILWQYKEPHASSFDGFILKYSTGKKWKKKRLKSDSVLSFKITNPVHDVMYAVTLQAYNSIGSSPESLPVKFKVVWNPDKQKDKIHFEKFLNLSRQPSDESLDDGPFGPDDGLPPVPTHNAKVRAHSSRRDVAFIIAGAVLGLVIIILVISVIIYHKTQALQSSTKKAGAALNDTDMDFCSKVLTCLCSSERSKSSEYPDIPPPLPAQCPCCSGAASPLLVPGSQVQSDQASLAHSAVPDNGLQPCSAVPGNSMCTVYYDYLSDRFPPFCSSSKPPLWWVRDGEFCHIIPHDAKPKLKAEDDEIIVESTKSQSSNSIAATPRDSISTYSRSGSIIEEQIDSQAAGEHPCNIGIVEDENNSLHDSGI